VLSLSIVMAGIYSYTLSLHMGFWWKACNGTCCDGVEYKSLLLMQYIILIVCEHDPDSWALQFISTSTVTPQLNCDYHAINNGLEIQNLTPDGGAVFSVPCPGYLWATMTCALCTQSSVNDRFKNWAKVGGWVVLSTAEFNPLCDNF
jgi:hypothetical protein